MAVISSESVESERKIATETKWRMSAPDSTVCDVMALSDEPEGPGEII
jgi:hypothetical protein